MNEHTRTMLHMHEALESACANEHVTAENCKAKETCRRSLYNIPDLLSKNRVKILFTYGLSHAITFEQKIFSNIHELKTNIPILYVSLICIYVELSDTFTSVHGNRHTGMWPT